MDTLIICLEIVTRQIVEPNQALRCVNDLVETLLSSKNSMLANANGDIGDLAEREMNSAAMAIENATKKLLAAMARPKDTSRLSAIKLHLVIHRAIG
jgi:hypothetical protein